VSSRIGLWLGIAFTVCFVTGLISHSIQHPPNWFYWPTRPVNLYRVTQGLHVITGIAAIPLLLAKLWSVYPKLFARPLIRSLPHAVERVSILVLLAAAFFELGTGLFNSRLNYSWTFFFPPVHYALAWVAVGALLLHIAVKLPVIRNGLSRRLTEPREDSEQSTPSTLSRRGFLRTTWLAVGATALLTAGEAVPWLRNISVLASSSNKGPQGLPVNRTAQQAGIMQTATDPGWALTVVTPAGTKQFSLSDLRSMPQTTVDLPISCVEGWSQSATWSGVRVADLLHAAGAKPASVVNVQSLERGLYASSTLPAQFASDPLTLLALRLNGAVLDLDHGFPCRIIAPNRPGVLQTKWVSKLEVLS
jgi:hypothetical protein